MMCADVQLTTLEARRNRLQSMCNGRFDVNKYSEQAIQLFNDIDKVGASNNCVMVFSSTTGCSVSLFLFYSFLVYHADVSFKILE